MCDQLLADSKGGPILRIYQKHTLTGQYVDKERPVVASGMKM